MAIVNLDSAKIKPAMNVPTVGSLTATNTDGFEYTVAAADEKTVVVVYNSDASNAYDVTIKQPTNACVGGSLPDKVVEVAAGKVAMIEVETAKYMDAVSHKITFDSENAALKVLVAEFIN